MRLRSRLTRVEGRLFGRRQAREVMLVFDIPGEEQAFAFIDGAWQVLTDELLRPDDVVKVYHGFDIRDL